MGKIVDVEFGHFKIWIIFVVQHMDIQEVKVIIGHTLKSY